MTKQEWFRLKPFWLLNKVSRTHKPRLQGRRAEKGRAAGYGAVLKTTHIHSMSVETQHFQRLRA